MGFFKSFNPFKAISRVIQPVLNNPVRAFKKTVSEVISNPLRYGTAISTGGLSEVVRVAPIIGKPFQQLEAIRQKGYDFASNIYTGGLSGQLKNIAGGVLSPTMEEPMSLNVGGLLSGISKALGGVQNPYFQGLSGLAEVGGSIFTTATSGPRVGGGVGPQKGIIVRPPSSVATVGRGFFNKFPNLATAIQGMRNMGRKVNRGQLHSMLKRFGPEILISGGILTAAAISELIVAGPGRRRMNSCNSKALNRAARRIKMFHKLCQTTDLIKTKRRKCS